MANYSKPPLEKPAWFRFSGCKLSRKSIPNKLLQCSLFVGYDQLKRRNDCVAKFTQHVFQMCSLFFPLSLSLSQHHLKCGGDKAMSMNHKTVTSPPWPYSYLVTSPESLAKDHDSQEYSTPGQNWPQFRKLLSLISCFLIQKPNMFFCSFALIISPQRM